MRLNTIDISFKEAFLLYVIAGYLIFNYGFMQLRIPPGGMGVPIGEIVLIYFLFKIRYGWLISQLKSIVFLLPFILWWIVGLTQALIGLLNHGLWAFRDATHVIESFFLLIGFVFARDMKNIQRIFRLLPRILVFICFYAIGYPFAKTLTNFSPKVIAGAGHSVPVFFTYTNVGVMLLTSSVYFLLFPPMKLQKFKLVLPIIAVILGFTVFMLQARTVYLQVFAIMFVFLLYRRKVFKKGILIIILLILALFTIFPMMQIKGRLGQEISIEFIYNHVLAIVGVENKGVESAANGVPQRIGWWLNLYQQWTKSAKTFFFGLGYGFPLIDFGIAHGIMVREPHNSYISIIARLGLIGAIAWVWMHFELFIVWQKAYKYCRHRQIVMYENWLLVLLSFVIIILVFAIGEDAFEKPFNIIPYYFFWGFILRFYYNIKQGLIESE